MGAVVNTPQRKLFVLGFGSVARSMLVCLRTAIKDKTLDPFTHVMFFAPEITTTCGFEECINDDVFSFHRIPPVTRETLNEVMATLKAQGASVGDVVCELACRIDTVTIWRKCKDLGYHFCNSGFDVWEDQELDLDGIEIFRNDPEFKAGAGGLTSVIGFGMNPGIISHLVRHGLEAATGLGDAGDAARAFGLKGMVFSERDNQWPKTGSKSEDYFERSASTSLYNTWSPVNFVVETRESTLLWPGVPTKAKHLLCSGPGLISWVPHGPLVGFAAPHDECFTVQRWFDKEIPAVFVYEASPPGRAFLLGPNTQHSSRVPQAVLEPGKFEIRGDCYDQLGVILLSETRDPFFCGVTLTVDDAAIQDPSKKCGPTPLQVCGGVWSCLRFIVDQPLAGDCFPEDVPTPFVMAHALPGAGTLTCCPCPEALDVPGFFDPSAPDAGDVILAASLVSPTETDEQAQAKVQPVETSGVGVTTSIVTSAERLTFKDASGKGVTATMLLRTGTVLAQLPQAGAGTEETVVAMTGFCFNHSCVPNCYLDRNRAVKTMDAVAVGTELTVDYAMTVASAKAPEAQLAAGVECACGLGKDRCRGTVGDWRSLPASALCVYLDKYPLMREVEEEARSLSNVLDAPKEGGQAQCYNYTGTALEEFSGFAKVAA